MRIERLWLDGYGCFSGREIEFAPGLQVIAGPNEQGKSTLRGFIADMLFGQKASTTQRRYEDHHEWRRPWGKPENYGGRMRYELDNGRAYEVHRVFDERQESVQVFDHAAGRDVTGEYGRLRNRESTFAQEQLGVTKAVFTHAAVVTHLTLERIGDDSALSEVREKLLSLADSADAEHTSETALHLVRERMREIGGDRARTKPLPRWRAKLDDLTRELEQTQRALAEIDAMTARRQELATQIEIFAQQHQAIEAEIAALERAEKERLLAEAEALQKQLDGAMQQCFALSGVREFPLEKEAELSQLITARDAARTQHRRTEASRTALETELNAERKRLGPLAERERRPLPDGQEDRLVDLMTKIEGKRERLAQFEAELDAASERLAKTEAELAALPDFGPWGPNALERIEALRKELERREAALERAREECAQIEARLAETQAGLDAPAALFAPFADLPAQAEDFQVSRRLFEEKQAQRRQDRDQALEDAARRKAQVPNRFSIAGVCLFASIGFIAAAFALNELLVFLPSVFFLALSGVVAARAVRSMREAKRLHEKANALRRESEQAAEEQDKREIPIRNALKQASCETVRELEGHYDRWQATQQRAAELADLLAQWREAEAEADAALDACRTQTTQELAAIGGALSAPDPPGVLVRNAPALYHEYHAVRQRLAADRNTPGALRSQTGQLRGEIEKLQSEIEAAAGLLRGFLRGQGFEAPEDYGELIEAARSYRTQQRNEVEQRSALVQMTRQLASLTNQAKEEQQRAAKEEEALERFLRAVGADSVDNWLALAKDARVYRAARQRRTELEAQLDALLRGESIDDLRSALAVPGPDADLSGRTRAQLLQALEDAREHEREAARERQALDLRYAQETAGLRPLTEIEEEQALARGRVDALEMEFEAAQCAAELIETVAQDRHARIGPSLSRRASSLLHRITDGAYEELALGRGLEIAVRNPQTRQMDEHPEWRLSKGTVDQIYLALRLALIESLSTTGERIPMLLDDPLVNYDTVRLERALEVLRELGETTQILFFTCHDLVAKRAEALGASVLAL